MTVISVVIPSYNDGEMLRNCLAALALQTRVPDEVLVVDNDSSDDTALIAQASGARVIVEYRRGSASATAAGFDAASGEVVARLDADSLPPADWLERIEAHFDGDTSLDALTGPGKFYGANRLVRRAGEIAYIGGYFWSMGLLLGHPPLFGSNFALRSSTWKRVGHSVHRSVREVHDDLDLSFQLLSDMRVVYDARICVGISARPFDTGAALGRRLKWAFGTIVLNARQQNLLVRWLHRRRFWSGGPATVAELPDLDHDEFESGLEPQM